MTTRFSRICYEYNPKKALVSPKWKQVIYNVLEVPCSELLKYHNGFSVTAFVIDIDKSKGNFHAVIDRSNHKKQPYSLDTTSSRNSRT